MNDLDVCPPVRKARVEIIPLIDVIFFLLATFVLFTLSLDKLKTLDVQLPKPGHETEHKDLTAYIQASDAGTFYWKTGADTAPELLSAAEIRPKLVSYRRDVDSPRVFIRSDTKARFGDAVMLLDEVRRAGITQVSIETIPSRTGK